MLGKSHKNGLNAKHSRVANQKPKNVKKPRKIRKKLQNIGLEQPINTHRRNIRTKGTTYALGQYNIPQTTDLLTSSFKKPQSSFEIPQQQNTQSTRLFTTGYKSISHQQDVTTSPLGRFKRKQHLISPNNTSSTNIVNNLTVSSKLDSSTLAFQQTRAMRLVAQYNSTLKSNNITGDNNNNNNNIASSTTQIPTILSSVKSNIFPARTMRGRGKLHHKLVEMIPKLQQQLRDYSSASEKNHDQQQQQHYEEFIRRSPFQRTLSHVSRLSAALQPKLKTAGKWVKSGCIKMTPFINTLTKPIRAAGTVAMDKAISPAVDIVSDKFDIMMGWFDRQIAKKYKIPSDQMTAVRAQVVAITCNAVVASAKAIAAYASNSGVMLAETLHSLADLSNQVLLLVGTIKALRASDEDHPYGYAAAKYIYGVLSASGVFFISCVLSLYHCVTQYFDDSHAVQGSFLTALVLGISVIMEGSSQWAAYTAIKDLSKKEGMTVREYFSKGQDTGVLAIFLEDCIAMIGLAIAVIAVVLTHLFDSNIFDTVGTGLIGLAMGYVSYYLFNQNEQFVLGNSMEKKDRDEILKMLRSHPSVSAVHDIKAIVYGEADTRVKAEIAFDGHVIAKNVLDEKNLISVSVPVITEIPTTTTTSSSSITTPQQQEQVLNNTSPIVEEEVDILSGNDDKIKKTTTTTNNNNDTTPTSSASFHTQHTTEQRMIFAPDGTIAGHQILHQLQRAGLSQDEAKDLLLRFGGECVNEVAREIDLIEKDTRKAYPDITHLDLECHNISPLDDLHSEGYLYPYLALNKQQTQQKKDKAAERKAQQDKQIPAWANTAKSSLYSFTQAVKGKHHLMTMQEIMEQQQKQSTMDSTQSSSSSSSPASKTIPISTRTVVSNDLDSYTLKPNETLIAGENPTFNNNNNNNKSTTTKYHIGKYNKPIDAKELLENEMFAELVIEYQKRYDLPYIDHAIKLHPYDDYNGNKNNNNNGDGDDVNNNNKQWQFIPSPDTTTIKLNPKYITSIINNNNDNATAQQQQRSIDQSISDINQPQSSTPKL